MRSHLWEARDFLKEKKMRKVIIIFIVVIIGTFGYYYGRKYWQLSRKDLPPEEGPPAAVETVAVEEPEVSGVPKVDPAEELVKKANEAAKEGRRMEAKKYFEEALAKHPDSPWAAKAALALGPMYLAAGEKYLARSAYSRGLAACASPEEEKEIKNTLTSLNEELIFSKRPSRDSVVYVVKKGDNLSKIGQGYDIPHELIKRINDIKGDLIYPDQRLKVIKGPFDAVIELQKFRLTVYLRGNFVKEYAIGIGKAGISPIGKFKVKNKLRNPAWTKPGEQMAADDPQNPLGERWIGIEGDYGIHGTIEPESIGKAVSEGCIRMYEADVEEFFDLIVVGKSTVEIRP